MGYRGVNDLRQGKYFEIALDDAIAREDAQAEVERIAREVLDQSRDRGISVYSRA